jgi:ankyrin repeat protein
MMQPAGHGTDRTTVDALLVDAVWSQDLNAARGLLIGGADPGARDAESRLTILMIAAGLGQVDMVEVLLAAGADLFATDCGAHGVTCR